MSDFWLHLRVVRSSPTPCSAGSMLETPSLPPSRVHTHTLIPLYGWASVCWSTHLLKDVRILSSLGWLCIKHSPKVLMWENNLLIILFAFLLILLFTSCSTLILKAARILGECLINYRWQCNFGRNVPILSKKKKERDFKYFQTNAKESLISKKCWF